MPFSGLADSEDFLVEAANTPAKLRMPLDAGAKFCDKGCDPLLELKEEKLEICHSFRNLFFSKAENFCIHLKESCLERPASATSFLISDGWSSSFKAFPYVELHLL